MREPACAGSATAISIASAMSAAPIQRTFLWPSAAIRVFPLSPRAEHCCPADLFGSLAASHRKEAPRLFAPPPHDGFALLAAAHTDAHALLRTHHTQVPSPAQYPLENSARIYKMPPGCFVGRCLMTVILPEGDESAMNFEAVSVSFRRIYRFPRHFCE